VPKEPTADETEVFRLHRMWVDANQTWNIDDFVPHMEEDVACFAGDGSVLRGRDHLVREWRTLGEMIEDEFDMETSEVQLEVFSEAAWLVYEFHLRGYLDKAPFDQRGRATELYRKRDGRWRMAVGHFSWIQ
jgi:ketosteroid isomerase-like protein